jgi:FkbM family methyltransferase
MGDERRRMFLVGCLVGVAAGGAVAFFAGRMSMVPDAPSSPAPIASAAPAPSPSASTDSPPVESFLKGSFAQQGEDLIVKQIFSEIGITDATYIDIGAYDPIRGSNTFLFYLAGSHGVLVEPNPVYVEKLRRVRPRDTVIGKGIGVTAETSADYYDFGGDGQDNTFSKEQADKLIALGVPLVSKVKMPLVGVNEVLAANFPTAAPSLFSVDTEGFDLAILKSLDFKRFRPPVICAETLEMGTNDVIHAIGDFLRTKKYVPRGGTFVNTIFVAEEWLTKKPDLEAGAGAR